MLLIRYLKSRIWRICTLILFALIFYVVLDLYNLPSESVLYAAGLCAAVGMVIAAADFASFRRRHLLLQELLKNIDLTLDQLPLPKNDIEADYQRLLRASFDIRAKRDAESDRSRTDLIEYFTLWAHQIKTPIAAMSLILQGLQSDLSRNIHAELFRIEQYVEMVLGYLRLDSENTDFVIREYALDDIVRQVVRKYAPLFIRKRISLHLSSIDLQVLTDEKWLCFAIEQVLSNALKYTPHGEISIFTEGNAILVIQDSGIGIAPEDLPRVFEKGYTGLNGRSDKRATGIGLYLTRRILRRLGHDIEIESELGRGTAVRIDLHTDPLNTQD